MENYRIIKETKKNGDQRFYVQKRFLWFFWRYEYMNQNAKAGWINLEYAEQQIQDNILSEQRKKGEKIVKKEIITF